MATEELYEVERIVDRRKNNKGKTEYLVHWRGFSREEDTWEPESHLSSCLVYIQDFNRQQRSTRSALHPATSCAPASALSSCMVYSQDRQHIDASLRSTRSAPHPAASCAPSARKQMSRPPVPAPGPVARHLPPQEGRTTMYPLLTHRFTPCASGPEMSTTGLLAASPAGSARRGVDLAKTGIKILVPKSPMNSRVDSEESPSEAAHSLDAAAQDAHLVPPEVALLEKPVSVQLAPGEERARMGSRPRVHPQSLLSTSQEPRSPAAMHALNATGSSVVPGGLGVASASGKRRVEQRSAVDKRLRFSVRQTESAYRYRDIVVKKQDGFTHILLSTRTTENNTLSPDVMKEIQSAMATAASDDSKLVLLSAVGSCFCGGLDFLSFIRRLTDDRKRESIKMAETIRTFVHSLVQFRKPIAVAVQGPALGLGAALLPLCDVVWASEKAWVQTPYAACGQTPDACSSFTFPRVMGLASASEMLLGGRKLTAHEACLKGLVSQVLWPGTFTQEVMLRVQELVSVNSLVLQESKALMRSSCRSALEQANERECEALKRVWGSSQGTDAILKYLQNKLDQL